MKSIEQNLADQQQNSPVEVVIDAGTLALK